MKIQNVRESKHRKEGKIQHGIRYSERFWFTSFTRGDYIHFFLLNSNILRTVFLKKGNLTNLLLVFEMADFKFSLSWSLCFWEQTPLIVLWSMWIGNTKINKSRFWKILYYYGINLYYYGFNLQCVSFRPTPGGAFPNTYLFRDGRRGTSTTSQSLIHTQE